MKFTGTTWTAAKSFLQGGRDKLSRPVSKTVYLAEQSDGSISLVLHATAIVTYHADGTVTLFHDGWRTPTTQRWLNAHSPLRVHSSWDRAYPGWTLGDSGQRTPSRYWKCRTCTGQELTLFHTCFRCDNVGMVEYGNRPIPIIWGNSAVKVDQNGRVLDLDAKAYSAPGRIKATAVTGPVYRIPALTMRELRALA